MQVIGDEDSDVHVTFIFMQEKVPDKSDDRMQLGFFFERNQDALHFFLGKMLEGITETARKCRRRRIGHACGQASEMVEAGNEGAAARKSGQMADFLSGS